MNRTTRHTVIAFAATLLLPPLAVAVEPKTQTGNETLSATYTENGAIREMTWSRPDGAPVHLVFRQDRFAGFSWHVNVDGKWSTQLPLVRIQPGRDEFVLNKDGIVYSLAYSTTKGVLEVVAKIKNDSGRAFSPDRALVNLGIDTEMVKYPEWNERFFPTLLRCEKTHFGAISCGPTA